MLVLTGILIIVLWVIGLALYIADGFIDFILVAGLVILFCTFCVENKTDGIDSLVQEPCDRGETYGAVPKLRPHGIA